jgi:hypothetical protein
MKLTAQGTDDCGGFVYFEYELDLDNNGTIDHKDNAASIDKIVNYGNHRVVWIARDECGNFTRCERIFRVDDVKKPTPICHSQIVSVVMPSSKMITLWAKDFVKQGLDNCSPPDSLRYSFSTNVNQSSKIFTCQDLVDNSVSGIPVRIYVFDTIGNSDFCDARLLLQDNSNVCSGTTAGAKLTVQGQVFDAENRPIEGVTISMQSAQPDFPIYSTTTKTGNYSFNNLKKGETYLWNAAFDEDASQGVNTLDLVAIQRHILGVSRFNSSAKMIAADVNKDQKITISDIVHLRKLVLGAINDFGNSSWTFLSGDKMPSIDDMYPMIESFEAKPLTISESARNFTGVKLGDIDFSYAQNKLNGRSSKALNLTTQIQSNINAESLSQVSDIIFDNSSMDLTFHKLDKNTIRIVILPNPQKATFDNPQIKFVAPADSDYRLKLDNGYIFKEEGVEVQTYDLTLRSYQDKGSSELVVYQNTPNPFDQDTEISFEISKEEEVTLKVYNYEGRMIYQTQSSYNKGLHKIKISGLELDATGLLYYQISTKTHYAGRRMIKLN